MPHFDAVKIYSCGKYCEKRRNCLFSIVYGTYFSFEMHFKMSTAIYFNLDKSKILSSGKRLSTSISIEVIAWGGSICDNFTICSSSSRVTLGLPK